MLVATASSSGSGMLGTASMIIWIVVLFGLMYFLMIRPQKKEQKRMSAMLSELAVGDAVVTTSGFYGIVIDLTDEDVIVEFGNNKTAGFPCGNQPLRKWKNRRMCRTVKRNGTGRGSVQSQLFVEMSGKMDYYIDIKAVLGGIYHEL